MATISTRNRNKGKLDRNGKPKAPNWEYRFDLAPVDGKRQQVSKGGFKTKGEAEVAGNKALAEYNNAGTHFSPTEISVADYLDYWIKNYCMVNVSDSTLVAYRNIISNHIKPRIGNYRLRSVTTMVLQEMINDIYVNRGFTKSFMKNILKVVKGSFKYAKVTAKLIQTNPAEDVTLPKITQTSDHEEIIILSKPDVIRILERFKKHTSHYYAILTAYYTGLRISEVYGLTWDCIDFESRTLTVNKICKKIPVNGKASDSTKRYGTHGKALTRWYFGTCKTPTSYRTISIGDTLLAALKEYKAWQEDNELRYGEFYTKYYIKDEITETHKEVKRLIPMQDANFEVPLERSYPVFIKEDGSFQGTDSMKYPSKVINYELGIHFNFHALRHTHATMLIEANVPVKAVSERLGHSNTRTTLETYVHVTDSMREDAVNKFETFGSLENDKIVTIGEAKRSTKTS